MFTPAFLGGKTVLVTGASSGLGRDFAIAASKYGARILAFGRDQARLEETLSSCSGGNHFAVPSPIDSIDAFGRLVRDVTDQHGPLYAMFHAAGESALQSIRSSSDRSFDSLYNASVRGAFALVSAAMRKSVMEEGGRVVLMSSASAIKPSQGLALYGSAKAAISQFVGAAAAECAKRKVTINSIAAGNVVTEMHRKHIDKGINNASERIEAQYPLGFGEPDDVSNLALYLMSPGGRWITGSTILLDGGFQPT